MRKLILPIVFLFTVVFFLSSKADAQTRQECEKTRDRASYNCLLGFGKCYSPCVAETKDNMGCRDSCKQGENACDKQVDDDYQTCLATIKKDSENPSETNASSEVQINTDCHGAFNKESNSCLKENTECLSSCADKARDAMSLTVDGGKVNLECQRNVCDPASKACDDNTAANFRACLDARKAKADSPKEAEAKKEAPKQDQNQQDNSKPAPVWFADKMPIFMRDWLDVFSTGHGLLSFFYDTATIVSESFVEGDKQEAKEEEEARDYIYSLSDDYIKNVTGRSKEEILKRQPSIRDEVIGQLKQPAQDSPFRLDILKGQAEIKYPGSDTWAPLKVGDKIPPGATIFTGMDTTSVLSIKDKGVLQILPFTEIMVSEEGLEQAAKEKKTTTDIKINTGDIEVSIEGGVYTSTLQVQTPSVVAGVRGTHFWVSYNKDKRVTTVGVYKGKVEVEPRGSNKPMTISPNGDKPGVIVVVQKLSMTRVAIGSLISVAIIGGIILILKRKFSLKGKIAKRK